MTEAKKIATSEENNRATGLHWNGDDRRSGARAPNEEQHFNGEPVLVTVRKQDLGYRFMKRVMDVTASGLALIVLLPAFAIIAAAIKLTSPGPVFFAQNRVGLGGRSFKMWNFEPWWLTLRLSKVSWQRKMSKAARCLK
jgi:lipopolysaccharide/colanic/teichoic acid biosynthesis glycosyltransferase